VIRFVCGPLESGHEEETHDPRDVKVGRGEQHLMQSRSILAIRTTHSCHCIVECGELTGT
jgi:hypothetical protein